MEKYRRWADPATGSHPFTPIPHRGVSILTKVVFWTIGPA